MFICATVCFASIMLINNFINSDKSQISIETGSTIGYYFIVKSYVG